MDVVIREAEERGIIANALARGNAYRPGYRPPDVEQEDDREEGNNDLPPPPNRRGRRGRLADPFQQAMIDFMDAVTSSIRSQNPQEGQHDDRRGNDVA